MTRTAEDERKAVLEWLGQQRIHFQELRDWLSLDDPSRKVCNGRIMQIKDAYRAIANGEHVKAEPSGR